MVVVNQVGRGQSSLPNALRVRWGGHRHLLLYTGPRPALGSAKAGDRGQNPAPSPLPYLLLPPPPQSFLAPQVGNLGSNHSTL